MDAPIPTNAELLAQIHILQSPAYQKLSRIHRECLELLELEATRRRLDLREPHKDR